MTFGSWTLDGSQIDYIPKGDDGTGNYIKNEGWQLLNFSGILCLYFIGRKVQRN
jgi:hypothetical protein